MNLQIDHKSKIPLYVQVEELLQELIKLPEYQNGKLLPKELELANRLGVSRNTIRQATNRLEYDGVLVKKKGVGTKVVQRSLSTSLSKWDSFTHEMNAKGITLHNMSFQVGEEAADAHLAQIFQIKLHQKVVSITKLRGTSSEPLVFFKSYFHPRIGVTGKEDFSKPLYEMLENTFGVVVVKSSEKISACRAEGMAAVLQIKPGDPLLVRERLVFDPGSRPVEFNIGYYRADKFSYSIDIERDK